jgi:iron complex transport system substrate-binding protein
MSGYYNRARERLTTIAPTETLRIYSPDNEGDALQSSIRIAERLARRLDRADALQRLRDDLDRAITDLDERTRDHESIYVVGFEDAGHVRVVGAPGLFDAVLRRAGLNNAWDGATSYWGYSQVPIERLDRAADHLVVVEPVPQEAEKMMANSPIWQALPAVRAGNVHRLEAIWSYGGVPSAIQFAERLGATLDGDD